MNPIRSSKDFLKTSFGNIIEWYDFSLYGIFAVSIAHDFFPNYSQFIALLMTFLTFSVSFMARPVGSLIFGYIGDKLGKRYSVNLSIWCMAIPTVIIGILPTYNQIGSFAPVLLILFRFTQGISVGGQFSGLIAIAAENPRDTRSYFTGLILAISMAGSLLASIIGLLSYKFFSLIAAESLAWRIPFIMSGILFFIYLKLNPTIEKEDIKSDYKLKDIFKEQPYELLYMTLLAAAMGAMYYILYSYSVTFMQVHLKLEGVKPLLAINLLLFISLLCFPAFGILADKSLNRIKTSKNFTLFFAITVMALSGQLGYMGVLSCFTAMAVAYCGIASYMTSMFAEIFHNKYRMTACSLCYSGGAVLGGFSPSLSEIVTKESPSGFYMLLLSLAFAVYLILDKIPDTEGYQTYLLTPEDSTVPLTDHT